MSRMPFGTYPVCRHSDRHRCGPAALPPGRRPRDRSQRARGRVGHRVPLGGHRDCSHRRRRFRDELPRPARPGDPPGTTRMGMAVPCDHRHRDRRQHHDAGCARGQTSTPRTTCQYTNRNSAEGGANPEAERKSRGHTICADQEADTDGTSQAGTDLCIGTTRPGTDSAGLSANGGNSSMQTLRRS